eukprot:TRINITY_DN3914_c0_g1_i1.p1 TRINITY_DN3914_c0_g1~~TRINITY_DN3914_c0_g1_i1.p1  ORF type:complete len:240 (-),score=63.79 TRINITY_DN3914_c0_g1_i1:159-878(-)
MALAAVSTRRACLVFSSRLLSRTEIATRACFATKADTTFSADEMLKETFFDVKKKFDTAYAILRQQKIEIDPDNPKAVSAYARILKTIQEKAGLYSESQRIKNTIRDFTAGIEDVRTYYEKLTEIREKSGVEDTLGVEKMRMDALDKVEKQIKKPLMRNDKKGMALLQAEIDLIYKKFGVSPKDLPKMEEKLDLEFAKSELEDIKKEGEAAMEAHMKRLNLKPGDIQIDVKKLDVRNFL